MASSPPRLTAAPPPQKKEEERGARFVWHVLSRNRLLVLGCFLITPVIAGVLASLLTPVYESTLSLRIDEKKSGIPVLEALSNLSDQGSQLNTEMEMLRSRMLAEQTVDSLALEVSVTTPVRLLGGIGYINTQSRLPRSALLTNLRALGETAPAQYRLERLPNGRFKVFDRATGMPIREVAVGENVALGDIQFVLTRGALLLKTVQLDVVSRNRAVERLRSSLTIRRPQRDANFVVLRYQSTDQQLSSDVPNVLAANFLKVRNQILKTEARSTVAFLRSQIDTLAKQLASTEDALRAFREGNQVVSLSAEAAVRVSELTRLQAERSAKESERQALQQALEEARRTSQRNGADSASAYRSLIAFPTLITTTASQFLQALNDAENQRAVLMQRRTRQDRDVQVLSARIRELEQQLSANVQTYLSGLASQIASMDAALGRFSGQLQKIPSKEMQFVRLERQNKVLADIYTLLQTRLQEAQIAQAVEDSRVRVVDVALLPRKAIKPNKREYVLLGALIGLAIGIALAILRESLDRAVHTREEVTELTGVNSLGLIPHMEAQRLPGSRFRSSLPGWNPSSGGVIVMEDPQNPVAEAYRSLRTNITFASSDRPIKTLVFTSPTPGDGKSTTAANLATTIAHLKLKVLLVDGDMRRGTMHQVFDVPRQPGLSNLLINAATVESCTHSISLGDFGSLDVIPSGDFPPNPSELFGSQRLTDLVKLFEQKYDIVIFDSPPVNLVTDAAVLGARAGAVVLIARAGRTEKGALAFAAEQLRNVRAPVIGTVLNDFDFRRDARYTSYGTSGYYYYGGYGYAYGGGTPDREPSKAKPGQDKVKAVS